MDKWVSILDPGKTIKDIFWPGTHDSASYTVNFCIPVTSNLRFLSYLCPAITANWTKTQSQSLYNQLVSGIRVFDLRFSLLRPSLLSLQKKYYGTHTFATVPIESILFQIKKFVAKSSKEIIIIRVSIDTEGTGDLNQVLNIFRDNFESSAPTNKVITDYPVNEPLGGILGSILLYTRDSPQIFNYWPNAQSVTNWALTIENRPVDNAVLNILDCVLTPDENYIKNNPLSSLKENASLLRPFVENEVLKKRWNVFMIDYPDTKLIELIVSLNNT